jgi:hypothetical protein
MRAVLGVEHPHDGGEKCHREAQRAVAISLILSSFSTISLQGRGFFFRRALYLSWRRAMRCERVLAMLGAYADGEVAGETRARLDEHLATCEGCRTELATLGSLGKLLTGLPAPALPDNLEAFILDAVMSSPSQHRRTAPLGSLLLRAAAALLVAMTGAYLGMRSSGLWPASPPPPAYPSAAASVESMYAGSFDLLPPDSPGAQVLALFQEEGR